MRVASGFLTLVLASLCAPLAGVAAVVVADLATDYQSGTVGQTTTDVGLPGTLSGVWNYYADIDHEVNGNEQLLTFASTVGAPASFGSSGYVGSNSLRFWPGSNFPVITDGRVFSCCTPAESDEFLQVHPGDPLTIDTGNPILAIRYTASATLENLILNYQLQPFGNGNTDYRIVQVIGGVSATIVPTTNLRGPTGGGGDTGLLSVGVSDMAAGDSVWLYFDSGYTNGDALPADDATNVRLTLTQIPEPASLVLCGLTLIGLAFAGRLRK